jgi:hypothetical protein
LGTPAKNIFPRRNTCDCCNIIELDSVAGYTLNAYSIPSIATRLNTKLIIVKTILVVVVVVGLFIAKKCSNGKE